MLIKLPCDVQGAGRWSILDGLKGLALVMVVLYHVSGVLKWKSDLHANLGVDIFLLVASFLLVLRGRNLSMGEFVRRRFFRIFPTYWVALALFLLLARHYFNLRYTFANIFLHAVGLHGFGPPDYFLAINDSFWFISILVLVYGFFLLLRSRIHDGGLLLLVAAIATTALVALFTTTRSLALDLLPGRVPTVFLGFIAGAAATPEGCELKVDWKLAALPLTLTALYWARGYLIYYPLPALGIVALYASFHRIAESFFPLRWLRAGLIFLGTYSYEIYLLHQPIIREYNRFFLRNWLHRQPNSAEMGFGIIIGLALVILASVFLHEGMNRLHRRNEVDGKQVLI